MVNVSVARRYARALLEASAGADTDRLSAQLASLTTLVRTRDELRAFLDNPTYTRAQQHAVLEVLIRELPVDAEPLPRFLRLLVDRRRLGSLSDIARQFRDLADERAGRIRGRVVSATPLAPETLQQLQTALESITHSHVLLETEVDAKVLGGVSAQVGSVLYDGTLRSGLDEMRRALKR
ncbi:MAG: ATP synthase F1 subunit delta [Myxococcaceae bacterium]